MLSASRSRIFQIGVLGSGSVFGDCGAGRESISRTFMGRSRLSPAELNERIILGTRAPRDDCTTRPIVNLRYIFLGGVLCLTFKAGSSPRRITSLTKIGKMEAKSTNHTNEAKQADVDDITSHLSSMRIVSQIVHEYRLDRRRLAEEDYEERKRSRIYTAQVPAQTASFFAYHGIPFDYFSRVPPSSPRNLTRTAIEASKRRIEALRASDQRKEADYESYRSDLIEKGILKPAGFGHLIPTTEVSEDEAQAIKTKIYKGSKDEQVVELFNASITKHCLRTLSLNTWVNDEVINAFLKLCKSRSEVTRDRVHLFTSFFYSTLNSPEGGCTFRLVSSSSGLLLINHRQVSQNSTLDSSKTRA